MVLGNTPEEGVRGDLRPGIADVFPGDAAAAGPGTHFVSLCSEYTGSQTRRLSGGPPDYSPCYGFISVLCVACERRGDNKSAKKIFVSP